MLNREQWLKSLISTVKEFADRDFQERVWLLGEGPEVSSWEEAMCAYFDDYQIDRMAESRYAEFKLTEKQLSSIRKLTKALNAFGEEIGESPSPEAVLDHPKWKKIRALANEVLQSFSS